MGYGVAQGKPLGQVALKRNQLSRL